MFREKIKKLIQQAIKFHWGVNLGLDDIKIEYPPAEFGDYSTNVALAMARVVKNDPMEVAEGIVKNILRKFPNKIIKDVKVIKPGFINFYLKEDIIQNTIKEIIEKGETYGNLTIGKDERVQVEFISANPTGPLTLGNGRGGFYGDALANILEKAGLKVEREYYINNVGEQIRKLGHSIVKDDKAVYKGKYIEDLRKKINFNQFLSSLPADQEYEKKIENLGKKAAEIIMKEMIKPVIEKKMKIRFDNWFAEASLYEKSEVEKVLKFLKEKDLVYEQNNALWFKSTKFSDEKDRVLVKADGEKTYLASDIAYLKNKFNRGFDKLIYLWGADHHGYIKRLKAAALALGYQPKNIEIIIMQLVRLISEGKEVRMSKRTGTYVTIEELIDEVGLDAVRFFFLMYSPDTHMNFDLDLAKEKSDKNPVYYAQYAHARISSILAKSKSKDQKLDPAIKDKDLKLLNHERELKLIKHLIRLPEIIEDIANDYQVHRFPYYLLEIVRTFHGFYEDCRIIDEKKPDLTKARLALVKATQIVLKNIFNLMGLKAPEKM